jgi:hypothetical protein
MTKNGRIRIRDKHPGSATLGTENEHEIESNRRIPEADLYLFKG